jgi:hypothetical protein
MSADQQYFSAEVYFFIVKNVATELQKYNMKFETSRAILKYSIKIKFKYLIDVLPICLQFLPYCLHLSSKIK